MSGFGYNNEGLTLKALLENSSYQSAPVNVPKDYKQRNRKPRHGYHDCQYDIPSMFLGPNIWDKTFDGNEVKLEYMDLDEFLMENGLPVNGEDGNERLSMNCNKHNESPDCSPRSDGHHSTYSSPPGSPSGASSSSSSLSSSPYGHNPSSPLPHQVDFTWSDSDLALVTVPGQNEFDPTERAFSLEELKPQPMIKKSRKIFIADEMKDERYWCRRKKNNVAAKRSRDARRIKENQVAMRAGYLEKENLSLKMELEQLKEDNLRLQQSLKKYEPCS